MNPESSDQMPNHFLQTILINRRCKPFWLKPFLLKPFLSFAGEEFELVWFFFFLKTLSVDGSEGMDHMEVPDRWKQVLRGPRPKAEKWPHQTVRNSSAAQMSGKLQLRGRTTESLSHSSTPQRRLSNVHWQRWVPRTANARVGIEAALKRVKEQAQAATKANRAPVPEAVFESSTRPSLEVGGSCRGHGRVPGSSRRFTAWWTCS